MATDILDSSFAVYAIGGEQFEFRTPRMGVLKAAARRNSAALCMAYDALPPGNLLTEPEVLAAAAALILETGSDAEIIRDSLRGRPVPELSEPARRDILLRIALLTWQMYGTLTLKSELQQICAEYRSAASLAPYGIPVSTGSTARN